MLPKVSIVIPVYNGADYMREAIDSALNQTYENCEVIVVNDGSTDETEQIALSYGDRIRYFAKENGGVSTALNLGIEKMEGDYFSWLSHDDVYYPWKIERQMRALQQSESKYSIVHSGWDQLQMPDRMIKASAPEYRFVQRDYQLELRPVLFGLINGCTTLIHKSHFERAGYFDETLLTAQDYDMWFRIFRGQTAIYIDEPLIMYRFHEKQGSVVLEEFKKNCEEIQRKMIQDVTPDEIERIFGGKYRFYFDMLRMAELNQWKKLMKELLDVFKGIEEPQHEEVAKDSIVLYCAGRNGKRLREELYFRGMDVCCFSDGNSNLWNTKINGIIVLPPHRLRVDDNIIVTKDFSQELVSTLKEQGYINVKSYGEISRGLYSVFPVKKRVVRYYSVENLDSLL